MNFEPQVLQQITKSFILDRVSQEEIFFHYLGVEIQTREAFKSPIRKDENPTCTFKWMGDKLIYRDWAERKAKDCFDIVQDIHDISYGRALDLIANDFGIVDTNVDEARRKELQDYRAKKKKSSTCSRAAIRVKRQRFTEEDVAYLTSYGLSSKETARFNVFSAKRVWLGTGEAMRSVYGWQRGDPALCYYFGTDPEGREQWKIYFYKRKRKGKDGKPQSRFMSNTQVLQGWNQLPKRGEIVCLTKSLKDVMVLSKLGVPSVAMQSENVIPYPKYIQALQGRFKRVTSLYDFDYTGIQTANALRKRHGVLPFFLSDGSFGSELYAGKDISDFVKYRSLGEAQKLVDRAKRYAKKHYKPRKLIY